MCLRLQFLFVSVVAILCGGKGTRIQAGGDSVVKPLVEVGGKPIIWQVMALYGDQGFSDFVLLAGWQSEQLRECVEGFDEVADGRWNVQTIDTGESTGTGGRVFRAREALCDDTFALTYADGLANIDLNGALVSHRVAGSLASLTVVQPHSPWGLTEFDEAGRVVEFHEKPRIEGWINGGFMFVEPAALEFFRQDDVLERDTLPRLAGACQLQAYQHAGFWACMDTYKDALLLNELCESGRPPWRVEKQVETTDEVKA